MRRHWERRCFHKMAEERRKVCSKLYSFSIVYWTEHLSFIVVHLLAQASLKYPLDFFIVFRSLLQIYGGLFIMTNRWAPIWLDTPFFFFCFSIDGFSLYQTFLQCLFCSLMTLQPLIYSLRTSIQFRKVRKVKGHCVEKEQVFFLVISKK